MFTFLFAPKVPPHNNTIILDVIRPSMLSTFMFYICVRVITLPDTDPHYKMFTYA